MIACRVVFSPLRLCGHTAIFVAVTQLRCDLRVWKFDRAGRISFFVKQSSWHTMCSTPGARSGALGVDMMTSGGR